MGINVWAALILGVASILSFVEFSRSKRVGDIAVALVAVGIAVAFYAAGSEPLLHP